MGGGEKKKTNQMANSLYNTAGRLGTNTDTQWQGEYDTARDRADDMYGVQYGGYKNFAEGTGTLDPDIRNRLLGAGGGGGGGPDMSGFNEVEGLYRKFLNGGGIDAGRIREAMGAMREIAGSGGWDAARRASIDSNVAKFKQFGDTGGLDEEAIQRFRGSGVFDEFAQTGGYSPEQIQNMRARATSVIPAMYANVRRDVGRAAATQGQGVNPALMARLIREQSREAGDASLNAELGIGDQVRTGRQWGASNISQAENALQGLKTRNQLEGLRLATDAESQMVNAIAANRLRGSEGWTGGESGIQKMEQEGKMFGTQGLEGVAGARASASAAGGARNDANLRWLAEFEAGNRLAGLEGMGDLYRSAPGEVALYQGNMLNNRGQMYDTQGGVIGQRYANNKGPDWGKWIGTAAGIGGALLTGGASAAAGGLTNSAGVGSKIWNAAAGMR